MRDVKIHPTAIVSPDAELGDGTRVGPFSIIEGSVRLGKNCEVQSHVVLRGKTSFGDGCRIYPFAVIGADPQHLGYKGEETTVEIGDRVIVRESATIHRGTKIGTGRTIIGNDSFIMAYTHVAHDCVVGKSVILANNIQLAGHVEIGDYTTIGGQSAIAQFCRVGAHCYIGGGTIIRKDVLPFLVGKGNVIECQGINQVGLSRKGVSDERISELKVAYKTLFLQNLTVNKAIEKLSGDYPDSQYIGELIAFIKSSKLGFHR